MAESRLKETFDHIFIAPRDFDRSLTFYKDILGGQLVSQWGGSGAIRGAIVAVGEVQFVLAEEHTATTDHSARGYVPARPTIFLRTADVDGRFATLPSLESVVVKPENTHWGVRWLVVQDPDGNMISFMRPAKE